MSSFENIAARKRAQIEAAKAAARAAKGELVKSSTPKEKIEFIPPSEATNKLRIVFDNSGSMNKLIQDKQAVEHAKEGVVEFLRSCTLNKDAVAIHLLNNVPVYKHRGLYDPEDEAMGTNSIPQCILNSNLLSNLVSLASAIMDTSIGATGGTPLFETIRNAQNTTPSATRYVAFSDGEPNNNKFEADVIAAARAKETPIDTVFFGSADSPGAKVMKSLAEKTGGIFLIFDPAKGVSFKDAFKYLSPAKRLMLMNAEFKAKLERGEIK